MPCLLIFGVFVFFPFVKTVLYSFTLTNSRGKPVEFVGLENYIKLFTSPAPGLFDLSGGDPGVPV
jgi:sn-glycerol 3-phosphate transport system permease protein